VGAKFKDYHASFREWTDHQKPEKAQEMKLVTALASSKEQMSHERGHIGLGARGPVGMMDKFGDMEYVRNPGSYHYPAERRLARKS